MYIYMGGGVAIHDQWCHVLHVYWDYHSITVLLCMSWDDPRMATPPLVYLTLIHVCQSNSGCSMSIRNDFIISNYRQYPCPEYPSIPVHWLRVSLYTGRPVTLLNVLQPKTIPHTCMCTLFTTAISASILFP